MGEWYKHEILMLEIIIKLTAQWLDRQMESERRSLEETEKCLQGIFGKLSCVPTEKEAIHHLIGSMLLETKELGSTEPGRWQPLEMDTCQSKGPMLGNSVWTQGLLRMIQNA
jgi:hypothetical protein